MDFFLHHDMRNLPKVLDRGLKDLRRLDESSRIAIESLAAQELDLFEEIQRLAKEDPDFDEAPIIEKYQNLLSQRLGAQNKLDDQIKRAQKLYDIVDGRITFVDSCVKDLGHLMPDSGDGTKKRKKRKRKSAENELPEEVLDEGPCDPSEPIYCTCRQISYGQMIACENPDCATEWFHFACVGLKSEPKEPWFCPDCH